MLSGCRVLELCDATGVLAGRILADLGADVVKIEPPGGDRVARRGLFEVGVEDPERSLAWRAANARKRSITLDCERIEGRAVLARLLARTDVLLETFAPGTLESWGFEADALPARLVRCAITPFGQTGPYASHRAGDLVLAALAGAAGPGVAVERLAPQANRLAAQEAVLGVLFALIAREKSGRGQLVDVSLHECRRSARAHAGDGTAWREEAEGARDVPCAAPRIGEHTREVLREAGFGAAEIARLDAEGVI